MSAEPVEITTQEPVSNYTGENISFQSASLYVGDLLPEVSEGTLFEVFNAVGPVASIRVCRDAVTRRSMGYAYVNFHQMADAERALDTMNFSEIQGKPCRIMWSQRDPSLRRSGVGNIFVKNLNESIDNKQLYDTFSLFGNILSCKVVTDKATGQSRGYGYVHYESGESARAAIEKLDGMLIDGQEVQVGEFMARTSRPGQNDFTNLYVKNIPLEWNDAKLHDEFSKFGEVLSAAISFGPPSKRDAIKGKSKTGDSEKTEVKANKDDEAKKEGEEENISLGFGFVNFADHEAAVAAIESLNGMEVETIVEGETVKQELFVGRAQTKSEREQELRAKFEAEKMDRISKLQGINLYVKNLDDSITDSVLRDAFAEMGTITSARVMMDLKTGRSKCFGFVCFSTPEEATRAVNEMNGKIMANKPIFVALAQRKDVRRAQLEAQHARGMPAQMMGRGMGGPMYPGMQPMYRPGPGGSMQPAYPMMPQMMAGRGPAGRGGFPMMQQPPGRGAGYPMPGYQGMPGRGPSGRSMPGRGGRGGGRVSLQQPGQPGIKFNQQVRNAGMPQAPMPQQQAVPQQAVSVPAPHEPLTAAALASASPEMQKNMIGERLYPLIQQSQPELAGKITGMLLEMDNSELLHLLESPDALNGKIDEAIQVLAAHTSEE